MSPKISVVTTLYHSAPYIREFYSRIKVELDKFGAPSEIIFVNDGSPDDALDVVLDLQRCDAQIIVIDLSRNFGHHKAILEGLAFARGEKIFLIDCDLEEPPETLSLFHDRFLVGDCDVVYGVQESRKGGSFERISGGAFYKLFNYLADAEVPENWTIARLMSRRYVRSLLEYQEQTLFLGGIMSTVGYKQVPLNVKKFHKGTTTYSLKRKISAFASAITSFSDKPLRIVFYSGLMISTISFLFVLWLVMQKLAFGIGVDGWTTLAVSMWLIGGLIILFLGVIGIYISKIFLQTKNRPLSIVRQIYEIK